MAQPAPPKNNYMVALACRLGRKKYMVALASQALRKQNYMVALAAGWNSDMSPYNYFFGEELYIFNFCQEQDALP